MSLRSDDDQVLIFCENISFEHQASDLDRRIQGCDSKLTSCVCCSCLTVTRPLRDLLCGISGPFGPRGSCVLPPNQTSLHPFTSLLLDLLEFLEIFILSFCSAYYHSGIDLSNRKKQRILAVVVIMLANNGGGDRVLSKTCGRSSMSIRSNGKSAKGM
ncbi:unnamed protein product [Cercopithifilaria johnstoni]|uniref:Uncharacterized protein n=1 Tax=Cercopithifilaria johnstoni TaxID=2874296 RepID=A0A8J2M4N0_9BILA|nr:unnamed protein product [Cercopithifilaria johnstoni]